MSTTQKVPPTNGTKPTQEPAKLSVATTTVQPIKKEKEDQDLPPLEDRLHRLNELFEVQTKFNRLHASKQKLNEFKLNKKSESIILRLVDAGDRTTEFETRNPELITEVLECVRQTIDKKIKAIEPQLKW
jgi:hypothetical protein